MHSALSDWSARPLCHLGTSAVYRMCIVPTCIRYPDLSRSTGAISKPIGWRKPDLSSRSDGAGFQMISLVTLPRLGIFYDWRPDLLLELGVRLIFVPVLTKAADNLQFLHSSLCTVSWQVRPVLISVPDDMSILACHDAKSSK
jgi:hypothetical protein